MSVKAESSNSENHHKTASKRVIDSKKSNPSLNIKHCDGSNATSSGQPDTTTTIMICRNKHYPYIASYHGPWLTLPPELLQSLSILNTDTKAGPPPPPIDPVLFSKLITIRKLVDDASDLVMKSSAVSGAKSSRVSHVRQQRLRELAVSKLAKAYRIDEIATSVLTMQSASTLDDLAPKVLKKSPDNMEAIYVHFFHEKIPSRMLAPNTSTEPLDRIIKEFPNNPEFYRTRAMIKCFREEYPSSLQDFKTAIQLMKIRRKSFKLNDCGAPQPKNLDLSENNQSPNGVDENDHGTESLLFLLRGACFHQYAVSIVDKVIKKVNETHELEKEQKSQNRKKSAEAKLPDEQCSVILTPSTAYHPSDVAPAPLESYRTALKPYLHQIDTLARRSIRDYNHFLGFFPNNFPQFEHPVVPVSIDSSKPKIQPVSLSTNSLALIPIDSITGTPELLASNVSTLPEFLNFVPAKNLKPPERSQAQSETVKLDLMVKREFENENDLFRQMKKVNSGCTHGECTCIPVLGTYHPLLVEAWYAIALNYFLIGDWKTSVLWHERITLLDEHVEGYPIFLPARSMSQADYVELLRLLRRCVLEKNIEEWKERQRITNSKHVLEKKETSKQAVVKRKTSVSSNSSKQKDHSCNCGEYHTCMDGPGSALRQLHTKRAETIFVWLKSQQLTDTKPQLVEESKETNLDNSNVENTKKTYNSAPDADSASDTLNGSEISRSSSVSPLRNNSIRRVGSIASLESGFDSESTSTSVVER
ncbi:hypothetical protein HK096_011142 [Nowakowskiella sp. JEL0078]|nr:hypothetical protein HK096_011142 [Nowakowskiella sp. JEL0078]